jgi:hypothetical protein
MPPLSEHHEHREHDGDVPDRVGQHFHHADQQRLAAQGPQHEAISCDDQRRLGRISASSARCSRTWRSSTVCRLC